MATGAGRRVVAMLTGALSRAAERALPHMPRGLIGPFAEVVGTLAYLAAPGARRAVRSNLAVISPGRSGRGSIRRIFVEQTRNYVEIFSIPRTDPKRLLADMRTEGWEHVARAYEQGKGVVLASAHLGPVSVVGQMVIAHGYPVALPVEFERSDFQRAVNRARSGAGLQLIRTDSPLGIFRVLREGKVLGILADRAVTGVGQRVQFFGREALLPSAAVVLSIRTGAPLVPSFAGRSGGQLTASFEPPLDIPNTGDREADVREGVQRFARVLERYVRNAPEQWTVFEDFWRGTR
ncbi:MAG TPA: lysophospholipid acyltransferase family protein [Candidatus Limnocylindria bacterium]|nr:lysophospholipid acyltransferase family protein [Candidatus Limnocylindria bacterium]